MKTRNEREVNGSKMTATIRVPWMAGHANRIAFVAFESDRCRTKKGPEKVDSGGHGRTLRGKRSVENNNVNVHVQIASLDPDQEMLLTKQYESGAVGLVTVTSVGDYMARGYIARILNEVRQYVTDFLIQNRLAVVEIFASRDTSRV